MSHPGKRPEKKPPQSVATRLVSVGETSVGNTVPAAKLTAGGAKRALREMQDVEMDRREILRATVALPSALGLARGWAVGNIAYADDNPDVAAFPPDAVKQLAIKLSQSDFVKPKIDLPEPFDKLGYDQYRDIRFKVDQSIWRGEKLDFELQLFPLGGLYDTPVEIWLADQGEAKRLKADGHLFTLGPLITAPTDAAPYGFSGLRIHSSINRADYRDEFVVFQGASYLRAVGRDENYGSSARGLALNTGKPTGEEFPFFRSFWIEKPKPGTDRITVHALLDSPSTTGAYRFIIQPGEATVMDVEMTLYPRKVLTHVGIGPLTSMFLLGPADQRRMSDFRPAVHDSGGLAMLNGAGERLWRPLTNPKMLQTSSFLDKDPKGFGLWQRDRAFHTYEDLEAHYERRPTVWVEPKGAWGDGVVELIEIPVEDEIYDNIVCYWKPAKPLDAGGPHNFQYQLHWGDQVPAAWSGARVSKTRVGNSKKAGSLLFVIDFEGPAVKELRDLPVADVSANPGKVANIVVQRNPALPGIRVTFEMNPNGAELVELRMAIKAADQLISESWLYRWTKP